MEHIDPYDGKTEPAFMFGYGLAHEWQEGERWGQALMNTLSRHYPEVAKRVPTEKDPFYDDSLVNEFLYWLFTQPEMQRGDD